MPWNKIKVHPSSNTKITNDIIQAINNQKIYWSDTRLCHWFFDFKVEDTWVSLFFIDNNECTVQLVTGV